MRFDLVSAVIFLAALACTDSASLPVAPTVAQFAKGGGAGTSVSSATPAYGRQGTTGEQVTITGSGFALGDAAKWERGGVPNAKVAVRETRFVSSTQLVATIDIAADADLAFYDIAVYSGDRKKGIGTEMFEVTTAINLGSLGGNTNANAVNDNGEAVGYTIVSNAQRAFYWSNLTGMVDIGGTNALGIDQAGATIVGSGTTQALFWTRSGTAWTSAPLPLDPAAADGRASAVASDPITGQASIIGGTERVAVKNAKLNRPRLWRRTVTGGWQKIDLPMPYATVSDAYAWVTAVNANGQAAGVVRRGTGSPEAVFCESDATVQVLGPGGTSGINGAGTVIAAFIVGTGGGPMYYERGAIGATWTRSSTLPGSCYDATGMDDAGRIVARGCPIPGSTRSTSAVFAPPYTTPTYLGGLGDVTEGATAWAISRNGTYVAGTAPTKPTRVAVMWRSGF